MLLLMLLLVVMMIMIMIPLPMLFTSLTRAFFALADSSAAPTARKITSSGIETTERITSPENPPTTEIEMITSVTYSGNFIRHRGVTRWEGEGVGRRLEVTFQ